MIAQVTKNTGNYLNAELTFSHAFARRPMICSRTATSTQGAGGRASGESAVGCNPTSASHRNHRLWHYLLHNQILPTEVNGRHLHYLKICRHYANTVHSAVSRPFGMSRYALADWNATFSCDKLQWYARVKERLHVHCMSSNIFVHWT
jgi:hypothetical protein